MIFKPLSHGVITGRVHLVVKSPLRARLSARHISITWSTLVDMDASLSDNFLLAKSRMIKWCKLIMTVYLVCDYSIKPRVGKLLSATRCNAPPAFRVRVFLSIVDRLPQSDSSNDGRGYFGTWIDTNNTWCIVSYFMQGPNIPFRLRKFRTIRLGITSK
jgi:hypothetical protein